MLIAEKQAERSGRTEIRGDAVLRDVNALARASLPPELVMVNAQGEPVINLEKPLSKELLTALNIKLKASELLMRHLGLFELDNRREVRMLAVNASAADLEAAQRLVDAKLDPPLLEYNPEDDSHAAEQVTE